MMSEELRLVPSARVLVAERSEPEALQVAQYLEEAGHTVLLAMDGEEALRRIRRDDPELVILGVRVPRLNAHQLCERLQAHPSTRSIPVVLIAAADEGPERARGLAVGAVDFLSRPIDRLELLARVRSLVRAKRLSDQVETTETVIFDLARMLESKMASSGSDSQRLSQYACLLGEALGLLDEDLEILRKGALLHDIGKIAVREEVLEKNGRLSSEEYNEVKLHPEVGERLCGPLHDADEMLPVIRHHQERWDGRGYPDGLHGEQIPLLARVMSIAHAYDAMLSSRPYRAALTPREAQASLRAGAGSQWDPRLVEVFLNVLHRERPELTAAE